MQPDLWTTFVFFGIPLAIGVLGVWTGGRLCYRAYVQYVTGTETEWATADTGPDRERPDRSWRGNALRGIPILVGATLVTLHSTRWLLRFLGVA